MMHDSRKFRRFLFPIVFALLLLAPAASRAVEPHADEGFTIRSIQPETGPETRRVKIEFTQPLNGQEAYRYLRAAAARARHPRLR